MRELEHTKSIEFIKLDFVDNIAYTPIGDYEIYKFSYKWFIVLDNRYRICDENNKLEFDTKEEAEKVAQFDFEKKVLKCIDVK